jgi:antitoxin (DNA-binding transcriptional repressor) of toxin-antitoxin stability system
VTALAIRKGLPPAHLKAFVSLRQTRSPGAEAWPRQARLRSLPATLHRLAFCRRRGKGRQAAKHPSTLNSKCGILKAMTMTAEIGAGQLAELVKQVQAGNEVLLTQGNKPVAKLVPAVENGTASRPGLQIRSLKGHRVLTPVISQAELAEEMFARQ